LKDSYHVEWGITYMCNVGRYHLEALWALISYQYENQEKCKFMVSMATSPLVNSLAYILFEKGNS